MDATDHAMCVPVPGDTAAIDLPKVALTRMRICACGEVILQQLRDEVVIVHRRDPPLSTASSSFASTALCKLPVFIGSVDADGALWKASVGGRGGDLESDERQNRLCA